MTISRSLTALARNGALAGLVLVLALPAFGQAVKYNLGAQLESAGRDAKRAERVEAFLAEARGRVFNGRYAVITRADIDDWAIAYSAEDSDTTRATLKRAEARLDRPVFSDLIEDPFSLPAGPVRREATVAWLDARALRAIAYDTLYFAAAYRLGGGNEIRERVVAQLEEIATWGKPQRPGYGTFPTWSMTPRHTAFGPGSAFIIRAIADVIETMPPEAISDDLRNDLALIIIETISPAIDIAQPAWEQRFRSEDPDLRKQIDVRTLEWLWLNETIARGTLAVGRQTFRQAYNQAILGLQEAANESRGEGAWPAGLPEAFEAHLSYLSSARGLAAAGESRLATHAFLPAITQWLLLQTMPGGYAVHSRLNAPLNQLDIRDPVMRYSLAWAAFTNDYTGANPVLWRTSADAPPGVFAAILQDARQNTNIVNSWAYYPEARTVFWRDSWSEYGNGFWLNASPALPGEIGTMCIFARGRPLLIEAGNPADPHNPASAVFDRIESHNVPQIDGGSQSAGALPRLTVSRMDAGGGSAVALLHGAYPELNGWTRRVDWSPTVYDISDTVTVNQATGRSMLFRWHIYTEREITVSGNAGNTIQVQWPRGRITFEGTGPIELRQIPRPDFRVTENEQLFANRDSYHICLEVSSRQKVTRFTLRTLIEPN